MKQPTRKGSPPAKLYCLPTQRQEIQALADAAGLSVTTYLLRVGLRFRIEGILDNQLVEELMRINGDLGRLDGLLKLWLTDDPRTAKFGEATIRAILAKIEETQLQMQDVIRDVVLPLTSTLSLPTSRSVVPNAVYSHVRRGERRGRSHGQHQRRATRTCAYARRGGISRMAARTPLSLIFVADMGARGRKTHSHLATARTCQSAEQLESWTGSGMNC